MRLAVDGLILQSPATGIARYTRELISCISRVPDVEVHYCYGYSWGRELPDKPLPGVVPLKRLIGSIVPRPYVVRDVIHQAVFSSGVRRRRIDVFHAPSFLPLRFEGPTVITVHDLSFLRYPEAHPAERVRYLAQRLPEAIERAHVVLVGAEFTRRELIAEFSVAPEKVVTTYYGVSGEFRPMAAEETAPVLVTRGLRHGVYLLSVGTLEPRKNLEAALEAFSRLPQRTRAAFPLVIVGMEGWRSKRLRGRAKGCG